ncbi:hypothetical protein DESC_880078 [Desulfosarcina cetonica]|uniref:diacylglycerol/lipid kinase family protein n=1 Tax=Desulfosarcina cetonica TaxID=90730 RepID=UPI0006CF5EDB|nr:diacylglycerol kinase family protein [Desulfosarcina cetonica]VTR71052.1 hypothetical protein DESC_880078 [Desulfosarcina cetonica]
MKPAPRYAIIANPASGKLSMDQRHARLKTVAEALGATLHGLDTRSPTELARCARETAQHCDILVVAGGDGTFSLVLNAVDLDAVTLAFLPFGTGNALTYALNYRGDLFAIAAAIRKGCCHRMDLIDCGMDANRRKKAFMTSVGIDGAAIRRYEQYHAAGLRGLKAHLRAGIAAYLKDYRPTEGTLDLDGRHWRVDRLLSLMVVKQPYFGMGLKAVPRARWDDGALHIQVINTGWIGLLTGLATGFTIGNRAGSHHAGSQLRLRLAAPLTLQIDGELAWTSDWFDFGVLPGALQLQY